MTKREKRRSRAVPPAGTLESLKLLSRAALQPPVFFMPPKAQARNVDAVYLLNGARPTFYRAAGAIAG